MRKNACVLRAPLDTDRGRKRSEGKRAMSQKEEEEEENGSGESVNVGRVSENSAARRARREGRISADLP